MTEDWKKQVDKEIRICNAFRVLFDERTKQQQKELDEGKKERLELYDYKNDIYRKLTFMKASQVDPREFRTLSKCVTTLKTEKKFLPWLGLIISIIVGLCMIFTILTSRKAEGSDLQSEIRYPTPLRSYAVRRSEAVEQQRTGIAKDGNPQSEISFYTPVISPPAPV